MAKLVENHIKSNGSDVITGCAVTEFIGSNGKLTGVRLADGRELDCELAVVAIGVRPNGKLAAEGRAENRRQGRNTGQYLYADQRSRYFRRR